MPESIVDRVGPSTVSRVAGRACAGAARPSRDTSTVITTMRGNPRERMDPPVPGPPVRGRRDSLTRVGDVTDLIRRSRPDASPVP
ncbi:hypothetical protein GCM10009725_24890 [Aeromicrobium tamlense]